MSVSFSVPTVMCGIGAPFVRAAKGERTPSSQLLPADESHLLGSPILLPRRRGLHPRDRRSVARNPQCPGLAERGAALAPVRSYDAGSRQSEVVRVAAGDAR